MANTSTNKYLSTQLQSPGVRGRTTAAFSDNRVLTATPFPYIETITPGKNVLSGFVGNIDATGNNIPEPNAYIYIYINGFLINPPDLNPDGTYFNTETAIVSDVTGNWTTTTYFFDALPAFQYGQTITFRAKAPLKQISERSVPYSIGGTSSPIELGVFGDGGVLRAPYAGESSIMGRLAYFIGHVTPYVGLPLYNCANHIYVYLDGMHAGTTSNGILGEVFANEIRGSNAIYPISKNLINQNLSLIVDNSQVDIPLTNLQPIDNTILLGVTDGINGTFTFVQPDANLGIKLYKNGMRLSEGFDYKYTVDSSSLIGTVQFNLNNGPAPVPADKLIVVFQYEAGNVINGEVIAGIVDGTNRIFNLAFQPRTDSIEIYINGLHLIQDINYSVSGTTITFLTGQAPAVNSLIIADYQPSNAPEQFVFSNVPTPPVDGVTTTYYFQIPDILGLPHVFKNGLLQQEGLFYDYTVVNQNGILFNPWALPQVGDNLLVTFYVTPVLLGEIINYLNQTQQFKDNCLTASTLNITPIINYVNLDPNSIVNGANTIFPLPESTLPVNFRLFQNGMRLKEIFSNNNGDYTLDYLNKQIIFSVPPQRGDSLVGLFNYIISDFVVGETPFGTTDGSNISFTMALLPKVGTVQVYYNGLRLNPLGTAPDYTLSRNIITFMTFVPTFGDVILVDYEVAFGFQTYTSTIVPPEQITGTNAQFSYLTPPSGTAINVFKNGLLQRPNADYTLNRTNILFYSANIPQPGDVVLFEFDDASLFTNNPNNQLRISSPYPLDIKRYYDVGGNPAYDTAELALFGDLGPDLYPGRDVDGSFLFFFNSRTGYWKWTNYDPTTGTTTPFTAGQRITARALNDSPFIYTQAR